ncbi:Hypothetical predicted protein, partial [Marmota monax]
NHRPLAGRPLPRAALDLRERACGCIKGARSLPPEQVSRPRTNPRAAAQLGSSPEIDTP